MLIELAALMGQSPLATRLTVWIGIGSTSSAGAGAVTPEGRDREEITYSG